MSILIVFPSGQWVGDIERLCALEPHSQLRRSGLQEVIGTQSRSAGQHLTYWGGGGCIWLLSLIIGGGGGGGGSLLLSLIMVSVKVIKS